MLKNRLLLVLVYVFVSHDALAGWSGFYKGQFQDYSYWGKGRDDYQTSLNNLVSIKNIHEHKFGGTTEFSYDLAAFGSKSAGTFDIDQNASDKGYRLIDLDALPYEKSSDSGERVQLVQNLNRFSLSYTMGQYELIAGRGPFGIGAARVVNPIDVWVPFGILAIDTEERYGIDGVRLKRFFSEMGEVEAAIFFQDKEQLEDYSLVVNSKFRAFEYDFTLLASKYFQNQLLGIDFQGDLFDAGIWGEAAFNVMKGEDNYYRASLGGEYRLTPDAVAFVEYHYNGAGESDKKDYPKLVGSKAYSEGAVFFLGEHYFTVGGSDQLHPLFYLSGSYILNLSDESSYISLKGEYNFKDNFYLDIGSFVGVSSGSGSEFAIYPDTIFSSLRYYF